MIIDYIKLKGFRSYSKEVVFEFNEGINVIIGSNGAGKTTALKALRLLLLDKSDATLEEFVNRDSESFKIEMKFSHSGYDYKTKLKYTLKSKTSERELYIDDLETPKYNTTSSVKEYLKTIFDPDLTYYAIALHQGSSEIIKAKDSARLELFKKIRNVDFNKQAEELKVEYDKLVKEDLVQLDVELTALNNKEYHFTETSRLPYTSDEIKQLEIKLENLILKIGNLKQKEDIEHTLLSLKEELSGLSTTSIDNEIKQLKENVSLLTNKTFEEEEGKIKALETYEPISNSIEIEGNYNSKLKNIYTQIQDKEATLNNITLKRIRAIDFAPTKESMIKTKSHYITMIEVNEKMVKVLESGTCPTCGKEVTDNDLKIPQMVIKENKDLLADNEKEYQSILEQERAYNLELEENEKQKVLKQALINDISSLKDLEDNTKADLEKALEDDKRKILNEIELNNLKLKQARSNLENHKQTIEKDIEHYNNMLGKTLLQKEELQERISKLNTSIKLYLAKLEDFPKESKLDLTIEKELIDKKLSTQKDTIAKNIQIEEMNEKLESEQSKDDKKKIDLMNEKDLLNIKVLNLKEARTILLKHFPNYIISSSIEDTENSMNDFLNTVYTKPLNIVLKSTATSLKMRYGEGRQLSCANLSGAENILTGLAFVNSLNEQLDLKFIFLDEVDAALTDSNKATLYDSIEKMNYEQMIIVTHNVDFQNRFEISGAKIFEVTEEGIK